MRRVLTAVLGMMACAVLAGCSGGSAQTDLPVGIGASPNKLKSSPCACIEQPNAARATIAG